MDGLPAVLTGLALLAVGAEMVVKGASRLAALLGIPPMLLGLTVVAIGTSMPELAVGIIASKQGSPGLAIGNIAGTNVFNLLFILGFSALLRPLSLHLRVLKLDLPSIIAAAVMMTALAWDGVLSPLDGALLLGAAIVYTVALIRVSRGETQEVKADFGETYAPRVGTDWGSLRVQASYAFMLTAGMGLTIVGGDWLVDGAVDIARARGISDAMIGLTIVAVGTSAPELATTIISTLRDERDVAIGNLLGSSIYNILVILALTCLATPSGLQVDRRLLLVDVPLMLAVALLCVPVFFTGKRVSRAEGGMFVSIYTIYMLALVFSRANA